VETVTEGLGVDAGMLDHLDVLADIGHAFAMRLTELGSAVVTIVVLSVSVDAALFCSSAAQSTWRAWKTSAVGCGAIALRFSNMVFTVVMGMMRRIESVSLGVVMGTMTRFVVLGVADAPASEEVWVSSWYVKVGTTSDDEEGAAGMGEGRKVLGVGKEKWESLTQNEVWDGSTAVDELAIKVDILVKAQGFAAAESSSEPSSGFVTGSTVELDVGKYDTEDFEDAGSPFPYCSIVLLVFTAGPAYGAGVYKPWLYAGTGVYRPWL
jgi:hypothetical protein